MCLAYPNEPKVPGAWLDFDTNINTDCGELNNRLESVELKAEETRTLVEGNLNVLSTVKTDNPEDSEALEEITQSHQKHLSRLSKCIENIKGLRSVISKFEEAIGKASTEYNKFWEHRHNKKQLPKDIGETKTNLMERVKEFFKLKLPELLKRTDKVREEVISVEEFYEGVSKELKPSCPGGFDSDDEDDNDDDDEEDTTDIVKLRLGLNKGKTPSALTKMNDEYLRRMRKMKKLRKLLRLYKSLKVMKLEKLKHWEDFFDVDTFGAKIFFVAQVAFVNIMLVVKVFTGLLGLKS